MEILELKHDDPVRGWQTRASVLVSHGANVVGLMARRTTWREWLHFLEPISVAELQSRPGSYGMPLLGPTPGRTGLNQSGQFKFEGQAYRIEPVRHGFLREVPWKPTIEAPDRLRLRLSVPCGLAKSVGDFPFQFDCEFRLDLSAARLDCEFEVINTAPDRRHQPFGLGVHPYLATSSAPRIVIPAAKRAELNSAAERTPTGDLLDVDDRWDFRSPRRVPAEARWDHVFADLSADADGVAVASTEDAGEVHDELWREAGVVRREILLPQLAPDEPAFQPMRFLQLYVPPHRAAVCLEPLSCLPDAVNLATPARPWLSPPRLRDRLVFRWSCQLRWSPTETVLLSPRG